MKNAIKKALALGLAVLGAACLLSACGDTQGGDNPPPDSGETYAADDYRRYLDDTFSSVGDASDCQGYRNWYYYCGDPDDDSFHLMTFNDCYGRWCSMYQELYEDTYMWSSAWLPGNNDGIGMGFRAPAKGKISLLTEVTLLQDYDMSGNGVLFTVTDRSGEYYERMNIKPEEGGTKKTYSEELSVEKGQELLFFLFSNSNNTYDFTDVNITIRYIGA